MTTELSFLIDLLLNHKLSPKTKEHVASRIREVESSLKPMQMTPAQFIPNGLGGTYIGSGPVTAQLPPQVAMQAPSTQALMLKHGDVPAPVPVTAIAQTPATIAAIESRNAAISASLAGKTDKQTGRPRKF